MHKPSPSFLLALLVAASACGKPSGGGDTAQSNSVPTQTAAAPPSASQAPVASTAPAIPSAAPKAAAQKVDVQIASKANLMAYDKTELTVPAGAEIHLVFKNNATMSTLPHNWVLVKPGTEASVAAAGLKLGEQAGYLDVRDHDVLANTPLAKPGETTEVTFTAPEAGKYPYVCTVPGHYLMMKGVLTVTP